MGKKKDFILNKANKEIKKKKIALQAIIAVLTGLVLYDSIYHAIPLYYIFFYFGGLAVGRFFRLTRMVEHNADKKQFELKTNKWDLVLSLSLLLFRFVFGSMILKSAYVVFISTALCLFF